MNADEHGSEFVFIRDHAVSNVNRVPSQRFVYIWVDGVHIKARSGATAACKRRCWRLVMALWVSGRAGGSLAAHEMSTLLVS